MIQLIYPQSHSVVFHSTHSIYPLFLLTVYLSFNLFWPLSSRFDLPRSSAFKFLFSFKTIRHFWTPSYITFPLVFLFPWLLPTPSYFKLTYSPAIVQIFSTHLHKFLIPLLHFSPTSFHIILEPPLSLPIFFSPFNFYSFSAFPFIPHLIHLLYSFATSFFRNSPTFITYFLP